MVATDKLSSRGQTAAPAAVAGPSDATLKAVAAVINDHRIHYGARLVKMVDGIETYTARVDGHEPRDFESLDEALDWAREVADTERAKLVVAALTGQQGGAAQPVAWRAWSESGQAWRLYHEHLGVDADLTRWEPLYAAPPAPSGLVEVLQRVSATLSKPQPAIVDTVWLDDECPETLLDFVNAALDATLSGQQGGAVPAGEVTAQELLDALNAKPGISFVATIKDVQDVLWELRRARLAEQPAPAGTEAQP